MNERARDLWTLTARWGYAVWVSVYAHPERLAVVLAVLVWSADAAARVGGGHSFGSGRSSRSSGSSHSFGGGHSNGGGGGGGGDLLILLIQLLFQHPQIGGPMLLILITIAFFYYYQNAQVARTNRFRRQQSEVTAIVAIPGLDMLRGEDPSFSLPVLHDFLQAAHRRVTEAVVQNQHDAAAVWSTDDARRQLTALHDGVTQLEDVVLAGVRLERVEAAGPQTRRLWVRFLNSRRELAHGAWQHTYVEEVWAFDRNAGAVSPEPEVMRKLGCPACGASGEADSLGACRSCGTRINDGRLQWRAARVMFDVPRRPVPPPDLQLTDGTEEPSVSLPTVVDPDLGAHSRAFAGRHPSFSMSAFKAKVEEAYFALQAAWSENRWEQARPYTSDAMFQSLRFWMASYARDKLRNRLEDVRLERVEVVKIESDAWYDAITVRLWGAMKDCTVDQHGAVVGGNATRDRRFSEYWTLIRAAKSDAVTKPRSCPACAAPLDRVNAAGVCGYCDAKITCGDHDWVVSRIDQVETWRG